MVMLLMIFIFIVNVYLRLIYFVDVKINFLYEFNFFKYCYRLVILIVFVVGNNLKLLIGMLFKFEFWLVLISKMRYCFILSNVDILFCNKIV